MHRDKKKNVLNCTRHRHVGIGTRCLLVVFHLVLSLSSILSEGSDSVLNSVLWVTQLGAVTRILIVLSSNTIDSKLIARGGAESSEIVN